MFVGLPTQEWMAVLMVTAVHVLDQPDSRFWKDTARYASWKKHVGPWRLPPAHAWPAIMFAFRILMCVTCIEFWRPLPRHTENPDDFAMFAIAGVLVMGCVSAYGAWRHPSAAWFWSLLRAVIFRSAVLFCLLWVLDPAAFHHPMLIRTGPVMTYLVLVISMVNITALDLWMQFMAWGPGWWPLAIPAGMVLMLGVAFVAAVSGTLHAWVPMALGGIGYLFASLVFSSAFFGWCYSHRIPAWVSPPPGVTLFGPLKISDITAPASNGEPAPPGASKDTL